jgi:hypothetical protein
MYYIPEDEDKQKIKNPLYSEAMIDIFQHLYIKNVRTLRVYRKHRLEGKSAKTVKPASGSKRKTV